MYKNIGAHKNLGVNQNIGTWKTLAHEKLGVRWT